jgi:hypothetical protein
MKPSSRKFHFTTSLLLLVYCSFIAMANLAIAGSEKNTTFSQNKLSVVFIDTAVDDYKTLANGVDADCNVVILDPVKNPIIQITDSLKRISQSKPVIKSVHIISHGSPGSLQFRNDTIGASEIFEDANTFGTWHDCLTVDADILLYGCSVAMGSKGLNFIKGLSCATGANVAASDDATGSRLLDGDWELERSTGNVYFQKIFNDNVIGEYKWVLATEDYEGLSTGSKTLPLSNINGLDYDGSNISVSVQNGVGVGGGQALVIGGTGASPELSITMNGGGNFIISSINIDTGGMLSGSATLTGYTSNSANSGQSLSVTNGTFFGDGPDLLSPDWTCDEIRIAGFSSGESVLIDNLVWTVIAAPEINVQGNSQDIVDGDTSPDTADHTDFGSHLVGGSNLTRTFTIQNTGTADLDLTDTPNVSITGSTDFSVTSQPGSDPITAAGDTTFQITLDPTTSGIQTAEISIANDDVDENPYNFTIQATNSNPDSDGDVTASATVNEPVGLDTTIDTSGEAVDVFDFTITDGGGGDGASLDITQIVVNVSGTSTDAERADVTWRLNGSGVSNVSGSYNPSNDTITFSSLSISIADNTSETYTVNAFYNDNTSIYEDRTFILSVDGDTDFTVSAGGTQMGTTNPITNGGGGTWDVVATELDFTTQPAGSVSGQPFTTQPVVAAEDAFGNIDVDFTEEVTLVPGNLSYGTLTAGDTVTAVAGVATFTNVTFTSNADGNPISLTADDAVGGVNLTPDNSNLFLSDVVATQLVFSTQPSSPVAPNSNMGPIVIQAQDGNNTVDSDFTESVTLSAEQSGGETAGTGSLSTTSNGSSLSASMSSGQITWANLTYNADETINIDANSTSFNVESNTVTVDGTPPDPVTITTPIEEDGGITSCGDNDVLIEGTGAESNATVNVSIDDSNGGTAAVTAQVTADGSGNWSLSGGNELDVSSLDEGTLTVSVTQTDSVGNVSNPAEVNVTYNAIVASAGPDQDACSDSATLAANSASSFNGSEEWSIVSGDGNGYFGGVPGTLTSNNPTDTFSGTNGQTYTLRWTMTKVSCTTTDDVDIYFRPDPTANAGADQNICSDTTTLAAVMSSGTGGTWTIVSGDGNGYFGGVPGTLTSNNATDSFAGTRGQAYTLQWEEANDCNTSTDMVNITFYDDPTPANAGPDQTGSGSGVCGTTGTLAGNTPAVGTGIWSITGVADGQGVLSDSINPTTTFSGTAGQTYTLTWTISNGVCPDSFDTVDIEFFATTTANAGADQNVCGNSTFLGATLSTGSGYWSILSGAGGSITTPSSPTSQFSGIVGTTYTLQWEETNGPCTSTDTVSITFFDNPTAAAAGPDQDTCGPSTTLAANTAGGFQEVGTWSVVAGSGGSFTDANNPTTTFNGTPGVSYTLRWTISNGVCPISSDDVVVQLFESPVANAGADQNVCGNSTFLSAVLSTSTGSGTWSIVSGAGGSITTPNDKNSSFSGTLETTYVLQWEESNPPCSSSSDTVSITFFDNVTTAAAGVDQDTCGPSTTLAANTAGGFQEVGTWSVVAGSGGSFTDANNPTTTFTGVRGTTYTLRWTISNGVCPISSDDVQILLRADPVANAGADQSVCGSSTTLAPVFSSGTSGTWTIVSGDGNGYFNTPGNLTSTNATESFNGSLGQTYTLQWEEANDCNTSTDTVNITFYDDPTPANAGPDQTGSGSGVCGTTATLSANTPTTPDTVGTWTITGVADGQGVLNDANDPTTTFEGTAGQTYTLTWTTSNGVCSDSFDTVDIEFFATTTANAGADQNVCDNSTNLAAVLSTGSGYWSILSGAGGSITTPSSPTSEFTGSYGVSYTLQWIEENGSCSSSDTVNIKFFDNPTVAAAGADQDVCCPRTTLAANSASGFSEIGTWSVVSGDGNGSISDSNSPTSTFSGTNGVDYTLRWTISNGVCLDSSDDVLIQFCENTLGITITESGGSTSVSETGTTDSFTVVLDCEPIADVTISISSDDTGEATVDHSSLTFTTANWDTPQTVTVTGVDEDIDDGNSTTTITVGSTITSTDTYYSALSAETVTTTNTDDDTAGFTITESDGSTSVAESGTTDTFTVVLDSEPTADVTISIGSDDTGEVTVDHSSLTFTAANWNTPQTVTVTGVDDDIDDGDSTTTITVGSTITSSDTNYSGLSSNTVSTTNVDDDTAGFTITESSGSTSVAESGTTDSFTVVLDSEPTADVTISIASDDPTEVTVDSSSLTFTAANWNTPQTVTGTGVDDDVDDGDSSTTITVGSTITSSDTNYSGLSSDTVSITNVDDDTSGFTITESDGSTSVAESGTTDTFTVVLDCEPTADVTISISSDDTDEATVDTSSLTFTSANWNTPQTVTVTGVEDNEDDGDSSTTVRVGASITSSDSIYSSLSEKTISVTNNDDVAPTVSSIVTANTTPTNADSVDFTVTFNETVQNVDTTDFSLTTSGTVNGTISSVNSSTGSSITVTVNTISGDGTLRLDLNSSGTGIIDSSNNAIANGFTGGSSYTIDNTNPTASISSTESSPTKSDPISITVTFDEDVTGFASVDLAVLGGSISNFNTTSAKVYTFDLTPTNRWNIDCEYF